MTGWENAHPTVHGELEAARAHAARDAIEGIRRIT